MRWPYEQIGVTTARAFRNLLNKIIGDIGADMQEHKDRADNLQAQVDNLVADGDSSPEAAQARVGADGTNYTTLKQRLDTEHGDVTAQLADKANQSDVNVLANQQDQLIAQAGDVTNNAELLDHRLDADGTIHATGGASMRFGQKGRMLDYNETALSHGYKKFIPLVFEKNGIVYSSGADMTSASSIRTPSANKVAFSGNIRVFNTKTSLYRWRYVMYNADGSYNNYVDWKTNAELVVTPDVNLLYRFEIGTIDGSTINMEDALKNIKVVYVSDDFGFTLDNIYDITDYILAIGGGQKPTFIKDGNNIEVTMPSTSLFFRDNSGKLIAQSPSQYYNQKFTVGSDKVLVWNLDDNTILVQSVSAARNKRNVVLLYNLYGNVQGGYFKAYYDYQMLSANISSFGDANLSLLKVNMSDKYKLQDMDSDSWASQGMTMVGDMLWNCNGSAPDHSSYSSIRVYDSDFNFIGKFTHNIGHMNTADYNPETDCLITGTYCDDTTIPPQIFIINGVSQLVPSVAGTPLNYSDENVMTIPLRTDKKSLDDYSCAPIFGERKDICYIFDGNKKGFSKIFKVLLGMGTNDLSDKSENQDDSTAWGTFIDGKSNNEYNGTAKVLGVYQGTLLGVNQDAFYHNGYIYSTLSRDYCIMVKIQLMSNGYYRVVDSWKIPNYQSDGTVLKANEGNGACLYKGMYYLSSYINKLVKIPLYNKQGGHGSTDAAITFDFPCNSTPCVEITPTSPVTDLYISQSDKNGFTVKSESGRTGTFNWEAMID